MSILRNIATLISGNVLAQAIALGGYLLLLRLFSPEEFGLYNIFYSYIEVLIILSTCKFESGMVATRSEREGYYLSRFALRLNAFVSLALLLLLVAFHLLFPQVELGIVNSHFGICLLIPFMVFFCGTTRVYTSLLNRYQRYKPIAGAEVAGAVGALASKALLSFSKVLHLAALPLGTVLGKVCANVWLRFEAHRLPLPKDSVSAARARRLRWAAMMRNRNYPLFVMPRDFVNSLSGALPFIWLATAFEQKEVGLFGLAIMVVQRPVLVLCACFEKVLYGKFAEMQRSGASFGRLARHFLGYVAGVALPFFVAAYFVAEPLLCFLFGDNWMGCGIYVRCLLPWMFVVLLCESLTFVTNLFHTQRTLLLFQVSILALRAAAVAIGVGLPSLAQGVALYAAVSTVCSVALLVWYLWQIRKNEAR